MLNNSKWLLSVAAVLLFLGSGPAAFADTLNDLKSEQKQMDQKKDSLNTQIGEKKEEISNTNSEIEKLMEKIKELNKQVADTKGKIEAVNSEIAQTTKEIEELKVSIVELEEKIAARDELLRERIRAVQVSGSVSYLDVLLGAESFMDFIDRFSAVKTLVEADQKILEEQAADKQTLEEQKKTVEDKLAQQEANKKQLVELKASLDSQTAQQNNLVAQLEAKQEKLQKEQASLQEEFNEVHDLSQEVEAKIVAEQKRIAEIALKKEEERKRKAAAEAAKKKDLEKNSNKTNASSNSHTNSSSNSGSSTAQVVSSGNWTRPASGLYTSPFGMRYHPIDKKMKEHRGADIANVEGTPIYAAGAGIVSHAGWLGGFGNTVMITHSVNGKIYTTVYAHLSSISVSQGQSVDKGQYIGGMGTTGKSTGSHLHFEFHIGNYSSGSSAVNPLSYVPF